MPGGSHTRARTPSPSASARDAHDPEPKPAKQADDDDEGASPRGHARPGADTQSAETGPPAAPPAATRWTTAMERRA